MLKSVIDTAKTKQPVAFTGIFAHSYYWLTSTSGDKYYQNPSCQKKEQNSETDTAIYFIHGTADHSSAFERVAERLLQVGLPEEISSLNLIAFEQRYHGRSIESFAEELKEKIKANQHQRVILMAHSRGGLVASYFAEFLAAAVGVEVSWVITVGTPFNGSYLAVKPLSWFSDSVREMEINSEFLLQLKEQIIKHAFSNYHFFIATEDAIVPRASGYIEEYVAEHPDSLSALDRHGHLSVMSSHRLVSQTADLLHNYFHKLKYGIEVSVHTTGELILIENYFPDAAASNALPGA
ncbi:esterase/lipase family protein [Legionella lytica]|uniref:Esterase/lipase family protein n=1 Tax=Legionella lytica TaxID=96232 RepID=A0ABW8D9G2_9GAMM